MAAVFMAAVLTVAALHMAAAVHTDTDAAHPQAVVTVQCHAAVTTTVEDTTKE